MLCLRCSEAPSSAVCGEQTVGDRMRAGDQGQRRESGCDGPGGRGWRLGRGKVLAVSSADCMLNSGGDSSTLYLISASVQP